MNSSGQARPPLTDRTYDIHGVRFRVQASSAELLDAATRMFRAFPSPPQAGSDSQEYLLRCEYGSPNVGVLPEPLEELWRGRLPTGVDGRVLAGQTLRVHELFDLAATCTNLSARRADVRVVPEKEWAIGCGCVTWPVCSFLAEEDQYVLHAACLWTGDGDDAQAVLISGESGRGKTTTSLALTRGDFRMASDDVTFVCDRDDGVTVWGLPRGCKVDDNALALLPWLNEYDRHEVMSDDRPEYLVSIEDQASPELVHLRRPGAILFLDDRNGEGHRLSPLPPVQAITRLARENVRVVDARSDGQAGRAFRAFGRLVRDCPAWSLSVGPDIASLPSHLRQLVR